jgi:AGZA family xanthine/uracil permease-like MFS transporter
MSFASALDRFFGLQENHTSVSQEVAAGLTTFMAMCYLIFVIPSMLADAGMPREAVTGSVVLITTIVTLIMGLWAKYPVGVAPGLGITAFFAYFVCGPGGFTWQAGLGAVLISGIVFFLLTVTRIRQWIVNAVPMDLKLAIVVGIGCFISLIGLKNAGIVVADKSTFVALGNLTKPEVLLSVACFFVTVALMVLKVRGAMLIGILATTAVGIALGITELPKGSWVSFKFPDISPVFMQLDLRGALSHGLVSIIFTLTMVDLFDNMGVLIGLARKCGFMNDKGEIKNLDRAFITDSIGTMLSSVIGTTTSTSYLESASGVAAGGRTGLTAVVISLCFFVSILFIPLVSIVPNYATAPILIIVGALMMQEVVHIHFEKLEIAVPAFLTIVTMPFTFNIATGFGFGFVSYAIIHVLIGRWRQVTPFMYVIAACFVINFVMRA